MPIANAWQPFEAEEAGLLGTETELALVPPGARTSLTRELQEVS